MQVIFWLTSFTTAPAHPRRVWNAVCERSITPRSVSSVEEWVESLRAMLAQQLPNPRAVTVLLSLLQSGPNQLPTVGSEIETLMVRGLVTARSLSIFEIRPVERV